MVEEKFLSEFEISRELHAGIAVTRFLLNRFQKFLQSDTSSGRPRYPYKDIGILIKIKQAMEKGQPLDQIEQTITSFISQQESFDSWDSEADHRDNPELACLQELLTDLSDQQKHLVIAQEKRVQVEERKAAAIEKRAKAEEQKAMAMGQIASALQELISLRPEPPDSQISQIACQTAQVFSIEEDLDMDTDGKDFLSVPLEDMIPSPPPSPEEKPEPEKAHGEPQETQDLSLLLDEAFLETSLPSDQNIVDISQDLDDEDLAYLSDLDDLSDLMEDFSDDEEEKEEEENEALILDDLSMLIEDSPPPGAEPVTAPATKDRDLDDLSALIQDDTSPSMELDDLSLLLEPEEVSSDPISPLPMDDLAQLLDTPISLKPSITPEQDREGYKAAIITMIIKQKTNGISPEQTAKQMNQDGVRTLSGKPQWSVKAVEQIYTFIDAAASQ